MVEQEKSFYISAKLNFFEQVLQAQHGSNVLTCSFETPIFESMILRVEHNIKVDEKTNR